MNVNDTRETEVDNIILPDLNSETYKLLFRNAGTNCGPVTRRSCGPISCKGSQLIYTIIALLNIYIISECFSFQNHSTHF